MRIWIIFPFLVSVVGISTIVSLFVVRILGSEFGDRSWNPFPSFQQLGSPFPENCIIGFGFNFVAYVTLLTLYGKLQSQAKVGFIIFILSIIQFIFGVFAMLSLSLISIIPDNVYDSANDNQNRYQEIYISLVTYIFYGAFLLFVLASIIVDICVYIAKHLYRYWPAYSAFVILLIRVIGLFLMLICACIELIFRVLEQTPADGDFVTWSLNLSSYSFVVLSLLYIVSLTYDFLILDCCYRNSEHWERDEDA